MGKIWDISQRLRPTLPVWPGDTAFSTEATWTHEATPVHVSKITLSTHSGAHADAPRHYDPAGATAEALDLTRYLGPCRVVDARAAAKGLVRPSDVVAALADPPPRILFRTFQAFPHEAWTSDFTALSAELVEGLADAGVTLVGTDAPSIDPETSKELPAHNAIRRRGLSILEGLVLDEVPFGDYELIALPLALEALDASPVRAVLRELAR